MKSSIFSLVTFVIVGTVVLLGIATPSQAAEMSVPKP